MTTSVNEKPGVLVAVFGALLVCSSGWAVAEPTGPRRTFDVPGFGVLKLMIPTSWVEAGPTTDDPALINVSYMVPKNRDFQMIVTALDGRYYRTLDQPFMELERRVRHTGQGWLKRTVEQDVQVRPLVGSAFRGYYYSLTDKTTPLPAGEFKHITQGLGLIGDFVVPFTIFTNDNQEALVEQGLIALSTARLERSQ